MKFHEIIREVMFRPRHFFQITLNWGIRQPLRYLIWVSLFTQLFLVYSFLASGISIPLYAYGIDYVYEPSLTVMNFILYYIGFLIYSVIFSFLWPAVSHLFIRIFNRHALYRNTYKSIIYSGTPNYVVVPFYFIVIGLGFSYALLQRPWLGLLFAISLLIWLAGHAYSIYLKLISIRQLHNISIFKAFLCLYVLPTVLLIVVEVLVLAGVFAVMWVLGA